MAPRASLQMAAAMGGCTIDDFYRVLRPLGFVPEKATTDVAVDLREKEPGWLHETDINWRELDVRPLLESGHDPLKQIMGVVNGLANGEGLVLLAPFDPLPLKKVLGNKGFDSFTQTGNDSLFTVRFYRSTVPEKSAEKVEEIIPDDWEEKFAQYKDAMVTIDVRGLTMPAPMLNVLDALDHLPEGHALFVKHERVPVFLLPELVTRGFRFRVKDSAPGDVSVLIFREGAK